MSDLFREIRALRNSLPPPLPEAVACNWADAWALRAASGPYSFGPTIYPTHKVPPGQVVTGTVRAVLEWLEDWDTLERLFEMGEEFWLIGQQEPEVRRDC